MIISGLLAARVSIAALVAGVAMAIPGPAGALADSTGATLVVVHGIRGVVADVWLDGHRVLGAFAAGRTAGPLQVAPGTHRLAVYASGPNGSHLLLSRSFSAPPGANLAVAVGLSRSGQPELFTFDDSLSVEPSASSLVVRDIAQGPTVLVRLDGVAIGSLGAAGELVHKTEVGRHVLEVFGRSGPGLLPATAFSASDGAVDAYYLIGSAAAHDLAWVANSIAPSVTPTLVQTGNSGLAAPPGIPTAYVALLGFGVMALAWALLLGRNRRWPVARRR